MLKVIKTENMRVPLKYWSYEGGIDDKTINKMKGICKLPFIYRSAMIMPDGHYSDFGPVVGAVVPTQGAVMPAAVGVDIGCGMAAWKTSLKSDQIPKDLLPLRKAIEKAVPHGRTDNGGKGDHGSWHNPPEDVISAWGKLEDEYNELCKKHPKIKHPRVLNQLGTMGTGNHFLEMCSDEAETVWFVIHSGSRGGGNSIGSYFTEIAEQHMSKWFIELPDKKFAFLPQGTEDFKDYLKAVHWAQEYAHANRELMLDAACLAVKESKLVPDFQVDQVINCHHNYIAREHHYGHDVFVTRKGAVRARVGDWGIIPGSMGSRSYIVEGLGNEESFCTCSHGAGRTMSRTEARKTFSLEDHKKATEGVECRKDNEVLDETPGAYKDIDKVMEAQRDLVVARHTLKQFLCVKG